MIISEDGGLREAELVELNDEDVKNLLAEPMLFTHILQLISPYEEPVSNLVTIKTEFGVPAGSIDIIAIDIYGRIYVIEAKSNRGRESIRKMVGQVLHYVASLWSEYKDSPDDLLSRLEIKGSSLEEYALNEFRRMVSEGDFKILLALDRINDDVKSIVGYLRSKGLDIYAVELKVYIAGNVKILSPYVFGAEGEYYRARTSAVKRRRYTERDVKQIVENIENELLKKRLLTIIDLILKNEINGDIGGYSPNIRIRDSEGNLLLSIYPESGSIDAYIGIENKEGHVKDVRLHLYNELRKLGLIDPNLKPEDVREQRGLLKKLDELSEEEFKELLNMIINILNKKNEELDK